MPAHSGINVSIHPMLMFISVFGSDDTNGIHVSIHPMLMFISGSVRLKQGFLGFNTSYVNVYLNDAANCRP